MCNKEQESVEHLFYMCESTSTLYDSIKVKLENKNINFNKNDFCFTINLTKHDYKILCIFCLVNYRNNARNDGSNFNRNVEKINS